MSVAAMGRHVAISAPARRGLDWRRAAGWAAVLALLAGWWLAVAPRAVGGPATFVLVQGHSMEPLLHTGDLVVTRAQDSYQLGDLVAVSVDGGNVIHRLHSGSAATGWHTKGDNRRTEDSWTITPQQILGKAWVTVPAFTDKAAFLRSWWAAPAAAALTVFLLLLPTRRTPAPIRDALRVSRRIRGIVSPGEWVCAWGLTAAAAVCAAAAAARLLQQADLQLPGMVSATGAVVLTAAAGAAWLRVTRGVGLDEAQQVLRRLRTRLHQVEALPSQVSPSSCAPRELVRAAARASQPVLAVRDPRGWTLLLVTRRQALQCVVPTAPEEA